jgi:hypothetical protein
VAPDLAEWTHNGKVWLQLNRCCKALPA